MPSKPEPKPVKPESNKSSLDPKAKIIDDDDSFDEDIAVVSTSIVSNKLKELLKKP